MKRPVGAPCWIDLLTSDEGRAREFYTGLFGWTAGEGSPEFGGYFMFMRDGVPVAGGMQKVTGVAALEGPDQWGVYLSSPDAKATVEKALAVGGALRSEPIDIADLGTQAVLADVPGARVGVWQARAFPGLTVFDQPGAPVWFELRTSDYAGSIAFYERVFDWQTQVRSDTSDFRGTVQTAAGENFAGIVAASDGDLAPGEAGRWEVVFRVADTDAAVARVVELGGTVLREASDTPFGRLAEAADPTGTRFRLTG
jgi:predicted enzyme related to lactoylglutathione lyase